MTCADTGSDAQSLCRLMCCFARGPLRCTVDRFQKLQHNKSQPQVCLQAAWQMLLAPRTLELQEGFNVCFVELGSASHASSQRAADEDVQKILQTETKTIHTLAKGLREEDCTSDAEGRPRNNHQKLKPRLSVGPRCEKRNSTSPCPLRLCHPDSLLVAPSHKLRLNVVP